MDVKAIFSGLGIGASRNFFVDRKKVNWSVVSGSRALEKLSSLPFELQYALAIHPSRLDEIQKILNMGHGLAMAKRKNVNNEILEAVSHIAYSYNGAIHPWLEDYIINRSSPKWTDADLENALDLGVNLEVQTQVLTDFCCSSCRLKLIQAPEHEITRENHSLIKAIEKDIKEINRMELSGNIISAYLSRRFDIKTLSLLALLLFAPIIHLINLIYPPMGVFLAAILPGLYVLSAQLFKRYSYGAAPWQILEGLKEHVPELFLSLFFAVLSAYFFAVGGFILSGIFFALACTAVFAVYELRRLNKARGIQNELMISGKLQSVSRSTWIKMFHGSLWWAPIAAVIISLFTIVPAMSLAFSYASNGLFIILLSLSPWLIFWLVLQVWSATESLRSRHRVKKLLAKSIIS